MKSFTSGSTFMRLVPTMPAASRPSQRRMTTICAGRFERSAPRWRMALVETFSWGRPAPHAPQQTPASAAPLSLKQSATSKRRASWRRLSMHMMAEKNVICAAGRW